MLISLRRGGALAAAAVSCASLVVAAPAVAKTKKVAVPKVAAYNVEFDGKGTYGVTGTDSNGAVTVVLSTFKWDAKYRKLIFLRTAGGEISTVINPKKTTASGDWSIDVTSPESSDNCDTNGHLALGQGGGIEGKVQGSGKAVFKVSLGNPGFSTLGGDSGSTACSTNDFWHDWPTSFSHIGNGGDGDDNDPVTGIVTLNTSDFAHGKIADFVSNVNPAAPDLTINPNCGGDAGTSCTQNFSWSGHLTLTKTHV